MNISYLWHAFPIDVDPALTTNPALPILHTMLSTLLYVLAGLAGGTAAQSIITDDTYFYGQSPPVYPSPNGTGSGDWADSYSKARALVAKLTLEEKVNLTGGIVADSLCSGIIPPIERVGFTGLCLSDAGNGVRTTDFASSWAAGISVGASWNRDLASKRAVGMAKEFRAKGVHMALGPVVGPLGRITVSGRNWEGFSNDPYLCGALAADTIKGIQSVGVSTSTKHFIGNEQETNRVPEGNVSSVSSNIDDKTIHEMYLWPFQDAVKAGTVNVMCSYNRVNNSFGCSNSKNLNGLLKTELGFQGFVVSDWGAQHAGVATALAGLDMVMPYGTEFWAANLVQAVTNGSVAETRLDDMATRIVATWYKMGQDKGYPTIGVGMPGDLSEPHQRVIAKSPDAKPILLQGAIESHVLLKNTNNALPLKSPKLISLFGYSAKPFDQYTPGSGGWNGGQQPLAPQDVLADSDGNVIHTQIALNGTLVTGGGSGANMPAYVSSPYDALSQRAYDDGTSLWWDFHDSNPEVDQASDACIVVGNAYASESWDRPGLHDDYTDALIQNVAANCSNTIVVFHNAGVRLVDQFIDHPNVTALIFAHLPGQDSGRALTSILYGDVNPSGKLPYSVPRNESDYGNLKNQTYPDGIYSLFPQSDFTEGVYIDYRAFDAKNISPRYEFGFGLSYTTFGYSGLKVSKTKGADTSSYPSKAVVEGGQEDLWDIIATVSATVTNTGKVAGAEAAQLYVGIPNGPVKQLRGFEKPVLKPGQSATVNFSLTRRDLSTWDVTAQKWLLQKGGYKIYVGASSRNLPLTGTLTI
ncbi:glycoside hydrolase family 3 protein [Annulohypoxylon truncatum]|uniref:glycoside hydrolase family 3 protein n=1 Tax=Annulohypoxylon truncatum TaxID=327061 RepID=UPI002007B6FE|nr:glycoside hydrolase family 3 protein [Annulohypoxylon truncatum]KAI1211232.1 glycoside hydrolase family 3 protein [Annulohypoxylon truncatum]